MTDFTTNYNLAKPVFDASIWHDEVNANFDLIDALLFSITGISNFVGIWTNSTNYSIGQRVLDGDLGSIWQCAVAHTSAATDTFATDRTNNPSYWTLVSTLPDNRGEWANETNYNAGDIVYDTSEMLFGYANTTHTSSASPNTMRDDIANFDIIFDGSTLVSALESAQADLASAQDDLAGAQADLEAATNVDVRTVTDSDTLALTDAFNIVEGNKATAMNMTVPPNSSVAFPVGSYVTVSQIGAGQVTIVAGSGVTLRSRIGLKLFGQYSSATLYKRATDEWVLSGDLVP